MSFILESFMRKRLKIEKVKFSNSSAKHADRWGRGIIVLSYLCALPFVLERDPEHLVWLGVLFCTLLFGFQSFVQWRYSRHSKEYIIMLMYMVIGGLSIYFFV